MRRSSMFWLSLTAAALLGACDNAAQEPAKDAKVPPTPAVAAAKSDLPDAEKLLAEVVESEGGAARWSAIQTSRVETAVEVPGSALSGTGKGWSKGGDFYQELVIPGVGPTYIGKQGDKIWSIDPIQGAREVTGKEAATYEMASSLNLANDWKRYFDRAETTAVKEEGGKKLAEVKLSSAKSGLSIDLTIDLTDKRVVMRRVKQVTPLGEIPVEERLEDYREQNGLIFSFRQTADMKLQKVVTKVTKLELDVPVDESKFAQPGPELVVDPSVPAPPPTDAKAPAGKEAAGKADPLASGKGASGKTGKGGASKGDPLASDKTDPLGRAK